MSGAEYRSIVMSRESRDYCNDVSEDYCEDPDPDVRAMAIVLRGFAEGYDDAPAYTTPAPDPLERVRERVVAMDRYEMTGCAVFDHFMHNTADGEFVRFADVLAVIDEAGQS